VTCPVGGKRSAVSRPLCGWCCRALGFYPGPYYGASSESHDGILGVGYGFLRANRLRVLQIVPPSCGSGRNLVQELEVTRGKRSHCPRSVRAKNTATSLLPAPPTHKRPPLTEPRAFQMWHGKRPAQHVMEARIRVGFETAMRSSSQWYYTPTCCTPLRVFT
jgi:hypothetical protein